MKCPIDNVDLVMSERQGVEIDYCPSCRGVWLDRGELDKLIERSARDERDPGRNDRDEDRYRARYKDRDDHSSHSSHSSYKKKKSSFLGELFDF